MPMYGINAKRLFEKLKTAGICGATGEIKITLLGTEFKISDKSATGNLLQEWLAQWMKLNNFSFRSDLNTQKFPDFYLTDSDENELLEVKTFDYSKSPNFDIANFDSYVRSVRTQAYRIDADYLIIGYSLINGVLTINDVWLKKIWEITCGSELYEIRTQVKQDKIHNIRPYNFKNISRGFQPFENRDAFLLAIRNTLSKYTGDDSAATEWLTEVNNSYKAFKGIDF